ncbi:hypothetical protein Adt_36878 [Abeliophyllum distichum]|uniref:Uncharacterized protein n=1 Tax=Abeliophyllum distichum TaxID=126358 RepID=A0ABD1QIU5_9LAMI
MAPTMSVMVQISIKKTGACAPFQPRSPILSQIKIWPKSHDFAHNCRCCRSPLFHLSHLPQLPFSNSDCDDLFPPFASFFWLLRFAKGSLGGSNSGCCDFETTTAQLALSAFAPCDCAGVASVQLCPQSRNHYR